MKDIKLIQQLANKYFEGKILPEEETTLFQFLNNNQQHTQLFRLWEKEWINQYIHTSESDAQWKKMHHKLLVSQSVNSKTTPIIFKALWLRIMSVAAIITITLLASWMVLYHQMNTEPQSYYTCSILW